MQDSEVSASRPIEIFLNYCVARYWLNHDAWCIAPQCGLAPSHPRYTPQDYFSLISIRHGPVFSRLASFSQQPPYGPISIRYAVLPPAVNLMQI